MKKLLRPFIAGAGVAGTVAAINHGLRDAPLPTNHLGGTQRRWTWRGYDIFAAEAGSGPLIVLVHGIYAGASSYEFRKLFGLLAETHRVVAFDLLGCGLSDRPNLIYSAELFVEQIVDALGEFGTEPTTLVGSSLGGAFTIRAAARAADRVAGLVTICPTGLGGVLDKEPTAAQNAVTGLLRSPVVGEALWNGLASRPSLHWFLEHQSYYDKSSITPEILDHYYAVTHQPGARFVPAFFVGGGLNVNVARDLPFIDAPVLIAWGEHAPSVNKLPNAYEFLKLARRASLVTFAASGLLPHEEEPQAVYSAIETFLTAGERLTSGP
ncbi:MAG: alpha/beta fold hydrolase [Candidatus Velthaea sp.]